MFVLYNHTGGKDVLVDKTRFSKRNGFFMDR
jgi:hypothetical protein